MENILIVKEEFETLEDELNYKVELEESWDCSKELFDCIYYRELDVKLLSEKGKECYKRKVVEMFEGCDDEGDEMIKEFLKEFE